MSEPRHIREILPEALAALGMDLRIKIEAPAEGVSYVVDEEDDCRNETEREAFRICAETGKAVVMGMTYAIPRHLHDGE